MADNTDASDSSGTSDRVHIGGKTFETTKNPPSQEEIDAAMAAFAEFDRQRAAVPPEERFHLSDKYGGWDYEGTEFEEEVNARRAARAAENRESEGGQ
jgi:hypothetical protein